MGKLKVLVPTGKVVAVVSAIDKIASSLDYLKAGWNLFCTLVPSVCAPKKAEVDRTIVIVTQTLYVARSGVVVSGEDVKLDDLKKAYDDLEKLLVSIGVFKKEGAGYAAGPPVDGWTPLEAPAAF